VLLDGQGAAIEGLGRAAGDATPTHCVRAGRDGFISPIKPASYNVCCSLNLGRRLILAYAADQLF
jgi:hypothetical protein